MNNKVTVAVVCAFNPNNAGMYSVDKAAVQTLTALGVNYRLFVAQAIPFRGARFLHKAFGKAIHPRKHRFGKINYSVLKSPEQFRPFSHILFWGDFLNNPVYGERDFAARDVKFFHSENVTKAFKRWESLFIYGPLMSGKRVGAIGGNFQHAESQLPRGGEKVLQEILNGFDLVVPRDLVSLQNLKTRLSKRSKVKLSDGMDCAFLLDTARSHEKEKVFSFHFGRSKFSNVNFLINEVKKKTGLAPLELKRWFKLRPESAQKDFSKLEESILSSHFVLTDTYHVSINALRLGVPVFCLGRLEASQHGTLSDFKKMALFELLNLADFYLPKSIELNEVNYMQMCALKIAARFNDDEISLENSSQRILEIATEMRKNIRLLLSS